MEEPDTERRCAPDQKNAPPSSERPISETPCRGSLPQKEIHRW